MNCLKKITAIACLLTVAASTLAILPVPQEAKVYAADTNNDDWLHTDGDKLVDMNGNEAWITGANWFGFNCSENCFHGSWYDVKGILEDISNHGINLIRVPISSELMVSWMNGTPNPVSSVTASNNPPYHVCNPDFADEAGDTKDSWTIFKYIVGYCKDYGIKIMMDAHSPHSDNSGHSWELWYGKGGVTTKDWIDSWVWLAEQFKNDDTIIAFDLENEPHGKRDYKPECPTQMAKWDDTKDENNWKYAAETCGKAILDVNPHLLIMVEGIEQYPKTDKGYTFDTPDIFNAGDNSPWYGAWWGGNLRGVRDYPIDFGSAAYNKQLVYSPHDYGPSVYNQTWFDKDFTTKTLLDDYWYDTWAYIDAEKIAPLLIGEWGGHMDGGKNQKWMELLRDYMVENRINHTFWCINPNSGDTGGLIGNDWATWDDEKYSLFEKSLWKSDGKYVGLDHQKVLGTKGNSISITELYGGKVTPPAVTDAPSTEKPTTTTSAPVTTTKPSTTSAPVTTTKPLTTSAPATTTKPLTTSAPATTTKPLTTTAPVKTTTASVTTIKKPVTNQNDVPSGDGTIKYGDLDDNGLVDVTDMTTMSLYFLKDITLSAEIEKRVDVTGDGKNNLSDLAHLKQYIMTDPVTLGPKAK